MYLFLWNKIFTVLTAVASQAMDRGGTKSRGPKVLGAPEQCSKKFNVDVSRNSRYISLNYGTRYLPNNGHCDLSTSK